MKLFFECVKSYIEYKKVWFWIQLTLAKRFKFVTDIEKIAFKRWSSTMNFTDFENDEMNYFLSQLEKKFGKEVADKFSFGNTWATNIQNMLVKKYVLKYEKKLKEITE